LFRTYKTINTVSSELYSLFSPATVFTPQSGSDSTIQNLLFSD